MLPVGWGSSSPHNGQEASALERIELRLDTIDGRLRALEVQGAQVAAVHTERDLARDRQATSIRWAVTLAVTAGIGLGGLLVSLVDRLAPG